MKKSYWAVMILNNLSIGVMAPVLSLAFIEKGCNLTTLSLILGLYSLSVFLLELPSGMLADLIGRKRVFVISCVLSLLATLLMLFVHSIGLLIPVVILLGAGRAFASGSVDAIIIEGYIKKYGDDKMPAVSSKLALCEIAGLSSGSILGGFLPGIATGLSLSGTYDLNIILRIVLCAVLTVLGALTLKENPSAEKSSEGLKDYIIQSFRFLKGSRIVLLISLCMLLSGVFLFTIETYWQPVYSALLPDKALGWTLGFIPFGFYLFAGLGNLLIKRLLVSKPRLLYTYYTASRILVFIALFVFSLQQSFIAFSASVFAVYFFFGGANVAESAILNAQIPDSKRAGMLSFVSFIFQVGGMIAPALSPIASSPGGVRLIWSFVAVIFIVVSVVIGLALKTAVSKNKAAEKSYDNINDTDLSHD